MDRHSRFLGRLNQQGMSDCSLSSFAGVLQARLSIYGRPLRVARFSTREVATIRPVLDFGRIRSLPFVSDRPLFNPFNELANVRNLCWGTWSFTDHFGPRSCKLLVL